jgi:predicted transcriptional regulator
LNLRIEPATRERLDRLAHAMHRPRSHFVEEALTAYLDVNEWQVGETREALVEADTPEAEWIEHEDVKARWLAKLGD